MRSRSPDESGAVTAELAVALPAVLLVLAACLGGLRIGAEQIRLADAAGIAARSLARHDPAGTTAALLRELGGPAVVVTRGDGILCARLERRAPLLGTVGAVPLVARGCALEEVSP
jgi:hypothetical protein